MREDLFAPQTHSGINLFRRKRVFLQSRLSVQRLLNVVISVGDVMGEEDCSLRNHGDYTPSLGLHPFVKHSKRKKLKVRHGLTRPFIPLWEYSSEDFALPCTIQELYQVVRKVFSTKAIHTIGRVSNVLISVGDESSGVSHSTYSCQHPGQEPCCNIGSLARVIAQELRK